MLGQGCVSLGASQRRVGFAAEKSKKQNQFSTIPRFFAKDLEASEIRRLPFLGQEKLHPNPDKTLSQVPCCSQEQLPHPSNGPQLSMTKYTPELHYQDPTKGVQACQTTSCYCTLRASQFGGGSFLPSCQTFTFTHSAQSSSYNLSISVFLHRFREF